MVIAGLKGFKGQMGRQGNQGKYGPRGYPGKAYHQLLKFYYKLLFLQQNNIKSYTYIYI